MLRNKKAAIGATITWVVATMIILLVITLFVYAAKFQSIGFKENSFETRYTLTEINKQQILFALLKTEIDGRKVEDYIKLGDYENLNKVNQIVSRFPKPSDGNWIFVVYEDNKEKFRFGEVSNYARDINPSFVYVLDKKIELRFEYLENAI